MNFHQSLATPLYISVLSTLLLCVTSLTAAQAFSAGSLPIVFRIGDHQEAYEAMIDAQEQTLLEACDKDVKLAYSKLFSSFREMEAVASRTQFDIKGVKLWLHFFWNADGSIAHLGYHLRPNSRNVNRANLEAFLLRFVRYYRFPLLSDSPYSLYTSVAFPLYAIKRRSD